MDVRNSRLLKKANLLRTWLSTDRWQKSMLKGENLNAIS